MTYAAVTVLVIMILVGFYIRWRENFKEESRRLWEGYHKKERSKMEVNRVVVGELKRCCSECELSFYSREKDLFICFALKRQILNSQEVPSWCPLVVENDTCVWVGKMVCGINNTTYYDYVPPNTCSNSIIIHEWLQSEYKFCPVCGKKIEYKEE